MNRKLSKEQIVAIITKLAEKLGRAPKMGEIGSMTPVSRRMMRTQFGNYSNLMRACGLGKPYEGLRIPMGTLFEGWATLTRQLKRVPTVTEFRELGKYSTAPMLRRCHQWSAVPRVMYEYAVEMSLEKEWLDVVGIIKDHLVNKNMANRYMANQGKWPASGSGRPKIKKDRPVYGQLFSPGALVHTPTNEAGVMFLFATMALELGFMATIIRTAFPDCEALREVEPGRLQRVFIEFEYESRNFLVHGHKVGGCDIIVCWINNWQECPLEVIALSEIIGRSGKQHLTTDEHR